MTFDVQLGIGAEGYSFEQVTEVLQMKQALAPVNLDAVLLLPHLTDMEQLTLEELREANAEASETAHLEHYEKKVMMQNIDNMLDNNPGLPPSRERRVSTFAASMQKEQEAVSVANATAAEDEERRRSEMGTPTDVDEEDSLSTSKQSSRPSSSLKQVSRPTSSSGRPTSKGTMLPPLENARKKSTGGKKRSSTAGNTSSLDDDLSTARENLKKAGGAKKEAVSPTFSASTKLPPIASASPAPAKKAAKETSKSKKFPSLRSAVTSEAALPLDMLPVDIRPPSSVTEDVRAVMSKINDAELLLFTQMSTEEKLSIEKSELAKMEAAAAVAKASEAGEGNEGGEQQQEVLGSDFEEL